MKTVGELLSALKEVLQHVPYKTLKNVIESKCRIESCIMLTNTLILCLYAVFF